jgi:HEAT repeat protein
MPLFGPPDIEKLKARRDVKGLIKALNYQKDSSKDEPLRTRSEAARALGEIGDPAAIPALVAALQDCTLDVPYAAQKALAKFGKAAVEPLVAALKHEDYKVRISAAEALAQLENPLAVEPLIAALQDSHKEVRRAAINGLAKSGDPRAVEPVAALLRDPEALVRGVAAIQLTKFDTKAVELLIAALKDPENQQMVAKALGMMRIWDVKPFVAALREKDAFTNQIARQVLDSCTWWKPASVDEQAWVWAARGDWQGCARLGSPAVEPLIHALVYADSAARPAIVQALGQIGDPRAVGPLITVLANAYVQERQPFIWALGQIGTEPAVQALVSQLAVKDRGVRQAALKALENIGWVPVSAEEKARCWIAKEKLSECIALGSAAVDPLLSLFEWGDTPLEGDALDVLGKIGDARAVEPLLSHIRTLNTKTYRGLVDALCRIGDGRVIRPLIERLDENSVYIRQVSARALVNLYQQGKLSKQDKELILSQRATITSHHTDHKPSFHSETEGYYEGNCSVAGGSTWSQGPHTDEGIGVDFPL